MNHANRRQDGNEKCTAAHDRHMYITMRPGTSLLLVLALAGLAGAATLPLPAGAAAIQTTGTPQPPRPRGNLAPRARTYTYFIEDGASADGYRRGDRDLATWALQAWERESAGTLRFVAAAGSSPRIRIK